MKRVGFIAAVVLLAGCAVTGVGVGVDANVGYDAGYYEPYGYEYGGWKVRAMESRRGAAIMVAATIIRATTILMIADTLRPTAPRRPVVAGPRFPRALAATNTRIASVVFREFQRFAGWPLLDAVSLPDARQTRRILFASMVGTTIEFYDFYIYATAAVLVFPHLFFPKSNATTAQLRNP